MINLQQGKFRLSIKYDKNYDYFDKAFIEALFSFNSDIAATCKYLLQVYRMQEHTQLVKDTIQRSDDILTTYVNDYYCENIFKSAEDKQAFLQNKIQLLKRSSAFSSVNKNVPTNTAQNIADSFISQITNDSTPIEYEGEPIEFIKKVMADSSWEMMIKQAVEESVVMGVSAVSLNKTDDIIFVDNEDVTNCVFVTQGAVIKYAYMKMLLTDRTFYYIYDDKNIYTMNGNGEITEAISHAFGVCPLQAIIFNKPKGIYETCIGDISAYDMAFYTILHTLTDPKNTILNTGMSVRNIVMNGASNLESNVKWVAKPVDGVIALAEYIRKESLENIVDDTNVVPEKMLRTNMNTATQSNLVMDKFNSAVKSYGILLKERMSYVLKGIENYGRKFNKLNVELTINPNIKEIINDSQRREMISSLGLPIETLRLLGYEDESIERILKEDIEYKAKANPLNSFMNEDGTDEQ